MGLNAVHHLNDRKMNSSYKSAGVDLETYQESMARLPNLMKATFSSNVIANPGGFAGLFQLNSENRQYRDPVLVSGTDGVGTKLKVASMVGKHDSIGIDLVGMCVNDVICCGADPLFFLDYVAMSKDDPNLLEQIVTGISDGCSQAECALIGGETAIMPDMYQAGEYDVAGFCVGVVEKDEMLDGSAVEDGDVLLGIASSGLHSNGYSLVRKIVFEQAGMQVGQTVDYLDEKLEDVLLRPTQIYASLVKQMRQNEELKAGLHGIAHITGGGLHENVSRILPEGIGLDLTANSWLVPPVFSWLQEAGNVESAEMHRVFNMGIGLVLILKSEHVVEAIRLVQSLQMDCYEIGHCCSL